MVFRGHGGGPATRPWAPRARIRGLRHPRLIQDTRFRGPHGWRRMQAPVKGYCSGTRVGVARVRVCFLKNAGALTRM
jgi:hypothetical protein